MNERRDLPPLRALRRLGYPDERLLAAWSKIESARSIFVPRRWSPRHEPRR
jgi:hypothetical protein